MLGADLSAPDYCSITNRKKQELFSGFLLFFEDALPYLVDIARADGQDEVAGLGGPADGLDDLVEGVKVKRVWDDLREVAGGDADRVFLARGVDLRQNGEVRAAELGGEIVEQRLVRLYVCGWKMTIVRL